MANEKDYVWRYDLKENAMTKEDIESILALLVFLSCMAALMNL